MKVFVAIGGWAYEGYATPIGVYTTEALAKEAIAAAYQGYDDTEICEYELDKIFVWPEEAKT